MCDVSEVQRIVRVISEKGEKPLMIPLDQTSQNIVDKYKTAPGTKRIWEFVVMEENTTIL